MQTSFLSHELAYIHRIIIHRIYRQPQFQVSEVTPFVYTSVKL